MKKPKEIAVIAYWHRHGLDVIPVVLQKKGLPKINNKFLEKIGVDEPELEREDENAEWFGVFKTNDLKSISGPREWNPEKRLKLGFFVAQDNSGELIDIVPIEISAFGNPPRVSEELVTDLIGEDEDVDLEMSEFYPYFYWWEDVPRI